MGRFNRYGRHAAYRMKQKYREDPFAFMVLWALFFSAIFLVFAFRGLIAVQFMRKVNVDPNAHLRVEDLTNTTTDQTNSATVAPLSGQTLATPATNSVVPSGETYIVKDGDTLYVIGQQKGKDWKAIAELNDLQPPYSLSVGQELKLP